ARTLRPCIIGVCDGDSEVIDFMLLFYIRDVPCASKCFDSFPTQSDLMSFLFSESHFAYRRSSHALIASTANVSSRYLKLGLLYASIAETIAPTLLSIRALTRDFLVTSLWRMIIRPDTKRYA